MAKPIVAIVGRPNVGKSQLFNRLAGKRLSIVEDTPGVTRDRLYADSDWRGRDFTVIDTGGIEPSNDNEILQFMRFQAETAISHADVIILITDLRTGITAADQDVASMLLRSGKPLVLAVNKCDKPGDPPAEFYEFYNLGLGEPYGISALHGYGVGELLDAAYEYFPPADEEEEDADRIRVALIGKPNVGKSSLLNRVLGGPVGKLTAGIFVILGHMFPLYFGFKGGKGVLVGAVMLAFFDWRVFVIAFALFILSVVLTKWISLGSILGAVSFPITTWLFYRDPVLTAMAFGMAAAVVFMHRSNIGRILHGTENKFSFKSKKTIEASPDGEEK